MPGLSHADVSAARNAEEALGKPRSAAQKAGMTWFTGIVVYLLVWWTALFAVLPIGTRPDSEGDSTSGGWRGAPVAPNLGRKLIITTLVSAVIWLGIYAIVESDWLSFRSGWLALPEN
jgi:predicted secreted protein